MIPIFGILLLYLEGIINGLKTVPTITGRSFRNLVPVELLRYLGPGFLITVGFIDPGNWATNLAAGSGFNYDLIWVITLSTLMLILVQNLSARLGIITGQSLAANIYSRYMKFPRRLIGLSIIFACVATDVAELLGGALGFKLLFGIPLYAGSLITIMLKLVLIIGGKYHRLERIIVGFLGIIALCFLIEMFIVKPDLVVALKCSFLPKLNRMNIFVAMGMLGAVVMPHNIFLHSNVILSRDWSAKGDELKRLIKFEKIDTFLSMSLGWVVNSAMIVVAAATFYKYGLKAASIEEASYMLVPVAGRFAQFLFGIALLFSGIGSSITSSVAEANVITAFLGRPEDDRSLFYRLSLVVTAIPAFLIIAIGVDLFHLMDLDRVLILSQVVLSFQLPLTLIPLIHFTRSKKVMGEFATGNFEFCLAVLVALIVVALNVYLLSTIGG